MFSQSVENFSLAAPGVDPEDAAREMRIAGYRVKLVGVNAAAASLRSCRAVNAGYVPGLAQQLAELDADAGALVIALRTEIAERSPEQVERMERAQGIG